MNHPTPPAAGGASPTVHAPQIKRQAELVTKLRGDLEQRLQAMHRAPAYRKLDEARYVMAAVFELLHAQGELNVGLVGAIDELRGSYDAVCRVLEERGA